VSCTSCARAASGDEIAVAAAAATKSLETAFMIFLP
jgi:hypothetical protein